MADVSDKAETSSEDALGLDLWLKEESFLWAAEAGCSVGGEEMDSSGAPTTFDV
jgi:hypothetical protein